MSPTISMARLSQFSYISRRGLWNLDEKILFSIDLFLRILNSFFLFFLYEIVIFYITRHIAKHQSRVIHSSFIIVVIIQNFIRTHRGKYFRVIFDSHLRDLWFFVRRYTVFLFSFLICRLYLLHQDNIKIK